uniref:Uncharacterized protein n=1 Tax=Ditylenchus dipsaci TaxID=166011 RepID=A0A915CP39_9BILA
MPEFQSNQPHEMNTTRADHYAESRLYMRFLQILPRSLNCGSSTMILMIYSLAYALLADHVSRTSKI